MPRRLAALCVCMSLPRLERRPELDALRGLFLVWMTLTHMPTKASNLVNSPLGYFSSAEGFVFISALLVGRLYIRDFCQYTRGVRVRLWTRSLKVYGYHLMLLAFAFTVAAAYAVRTHEAALCNLLDFYLAHPLVAIAGSLLLLYCPPLLDILPMYVIFLFFTPLLLPAAVRFGWRKILFASGCIWLAAQFGLRDLFHNWIVRITHLHIPLQEMGAFNLFAWQTVWIVGLWLGARSATRTGPLMRTRRWLVAIAWAVCLFFFGVRLNWFGSHLSQQALGIWLNKWQLAPLRVLNIAAFAIVFYWLRKYLLRIVSIEPFLTLGKASLQVFCTQIVFVFVALALLYQEVGQDVPGGPPPTLHFTTAAVVLLVTFPVLYLVAQREVRKKRRARPRQTPPEPPRTQPPPAVRSQPLEMCKSGRSSGLERFHNTCSLFWR